MFVILILLEISVHVFLTVNSVTRSDEHRILLTSPLLSLQSVSASLARCFAFMADPMVTHYIENVTYAWFRLMKLRILISI